jgi:hypothetical protein
MFATAGRYFLLGFLFVSLVPGCKSEKPVEPKKQEPVPLHAASVPLPSNSGAWFSEDLIGKIELSAGAQAELLTTMEVRSENLKGDEGVEEEKLAGFSVRTKKTDDLISSYRSGLRVKGYLIFKSHQGYGSLPDMVTIVRGNNSYDILKIQGTEAFNYNLDTQAIINWLKQQQRFGSFVITGAGPDWVEARFVKQPGDLRAFAETVQAFAPDVREYGPKTVGKFAEHMKKINGFYLVWD